MRNPTFTSTTLDPKLAEGGSLLSNAYVSDEKWGLDFTVGSLSDFATSIVEDSIQEWIQKKNVNPNTNMIPDTQINRVVTENVTLQDLENLVGSTDYDPELYKGVADYFNKKGYNISPQDARNIVLEQYYSDAKKLSSIRNEYGTVGEFFSEAGASIGHIFTNPLRFTSAVAGVAIAGAGVGALAGSGLGPAGSLTGAAAGLVVGIAEGVAIAHTDAIVNAFVVNKRREALGLKPIDVASALINESLVGAALPLVIGGAVMTAKFATAAARTASTPLWERAVGLFNDTRAGRSKRTGYEGEDVLTSQLHTPVERMEAQWGYNIDPKDLNAATDAPRETYSWKMNNVSRETFVHSEINFTRTEAGSTTKRSSSWAYDADPSTPVLNRNVFNSIGSVMADTDFVSTISVLDRDRLKSFVSGMSEKDLGLFSESLRVAKGSKEELKAFIATLRKADSRESFIKNMRDNLFPGDRVRFHVKQENLRTTMDSETFRHVQAYSDDAAILENYLIQGEKEHFIPDQTPGNPYINRINEATTGEGIESARSEAAAWEQARSDAIEYGFDPSKPFTPTAYMLSMISKLNSYTAIREALRAKYAGAFEKLAGMEASSLIQAFMPESVLQSPLEKNAGTIRRALAELKGERRDILGRYGFEYGAIDDHVPQRWAAESVGQAGLEKFVNDVFPTLDLERTKKSYDNSTIESKANLEKRFVSEQKKLKAKNDRAIKQNEKIFDLVADQRAAEKEKIRLINQLKSTGRTITNENNRLTNAFLKNVQAQSDLLTELDFAKEVQLQNVEKTRAKDLIKRLNAEKKNVQTLQSSVRSTQGRIWNSVFKYSEISSKVETTALGNEISGLKSETNAQLKDINNHVRLLEKNLAIAEQKLEAANVPRETDYVLTLRAQINSLKAKIDGMERSIGFFSDVETQVAQENTTGITKAVSDLQDFLVTEQERIVKLISKREEKLSGIEAGTIKLPKSTFERRVLAAEKKVENAQATLLQKLRKRAQVQRKIQRLSGEQGNLQEIRTIKTLANEVKGRDLSALQTQIKRKADLEKRLVEIDSKIQTQKGIVSEPDRIELQRSKAATETMLNNANKAITSLSKNVEKNDKFIAMTEIDPGALQLARKTRDRLGARAQRLIKRTYPEDNAIMRRITNRIGELNKTLQKPFSKAELAQIYHNITQDDLLSFGTESVNTRVSGQKRRILHFNNISEFDRINKLYGTTPDIRNLIRLDFESNIRDIARIQALDGLSGSGFMKEIESKLKILLNGRQLGSFTESIVKGLVEANVKYIDGLKNKQRLSTAGAATNLYMALRRNATLGGSGLTALFDDAQQAAFVGSENGFGLIRTLQYYVDGLRKVKLSAEEASKLLVHLDSLDVSFNDEFFRDMQTKTARDLSAAAQNIDNFTFKVSGNSYITDRGRYAYHKLFLEELANIQSRPQFQKTLKGFGLTEADFRAINSLPRDVDGYVEFTPAFKETRAYTKILTALHTTRRNAIAQTSQSLRAVMATSEGLLGTSLGVMNSLFFLKRIPLQVWFDHALIPIMRGEWGKFTTYTIQNMIATTLRLTLKYLAMGYTPDPQDPHFWREVFFQTSVVPPIGKELLTMNKLNAYDFSQAIGRTFLGAWSPAVDILSFAAGIANPQNMGPLGVRVLEDFAPLRNHPALAALYERYIFDNLKLTLDPRAMEHLARRERFRRDSGLLRQGNPVGW